MNENRHCYYYEKRMYYDGFLNKKVDATYIIHLENNGRYEDIQKQLTVYHPTNILYIVHNKGYKNCNKHEFIQEPAYDLIDAFLQIFKHANHSHYENILILEDDFLFCDKIKEPIHQTNILDFLHKKQNIPFIYSLGCLPFLQIPYDYNNYRLLVSCGSHACIYSKKIRENILMQKQESIGDWDIYINMYKGYYRYNYYTPLCYQLMPITENSKNWGKSNIFTQMGGILLFQLFQLFQLDIYVEPGYSIFYAFSKINIIVIILIFLFLFYLFKYKRKTNTIKFVI